MCVLFINGWFSCGSTKSFLCVMRVWIRFLSFDLLCDYWWTLFRHLFLFCLCIVHNFVRSTSIALDWFMRFLWLNRQALLLFFFFLYDIIICCNCDWLLLYRFFSFFRNLILRLSRLFYLRGCLLLPLI